MTPNDVMDRLAAIARKKDDDEVAHSMEDQLHFDVLQAIANGDCDQYQECARLALTTTEIDFARWCA